MMIDQGFATDPAFDGLSAAARGVFAGIAATLRQSRRTSLYADAMPSWIARETACLAELEAAGLLDTSTGCYALGELEAPFARASMAPVEPTVTRDDDESPDDRKRRLARDRQQTKRDKQRDASRKPSVTERDEQRDEVRDVLASEEKREEKEEKKQENTAEGARVMERDGQRDEVRDSVTGSVTPPLALSPPPAKRQRAPRATDVATLPVGWEPGAELRSYAAERGIDAERLLEDFRDYWTAGGGSRERRTVSGWEQTWRTKVRECVDRRRFLAGASKGPTRSYGATRAAPRQGDLDAAGKPPSWDDVWELQERDDAAAAAKAAGKVA